MAVVPPSFSKVASFVVISAAIVSSAWMLYSAVAAYQVNKLTFSNTMEWGPAPARAALEFPYFEPSWKNSIALPPPPTNASRVTQQELAKLRADISLRTPEKLAEINTEKGLWDAILGGRPIGVYVIADTYPLTAELLAKSLNDVSVIAMKEKQRFDRVRPSFLDPAIAPAIDIPGHPAYPSGHSTQAHFVAYVLSELMPDKKEELVRDADRIAVNREIAGVHYPSDTAAGVLLAQQYFALLMKNPEFLEMLEKAKTEWR